MTDPQSLIPKVTEYVHEYMSKFDASHDFDHIKRVVGLARTIYLEIQTTNAPNQPNLDPDIITLAALLHDVGDSKYVQDKKKARKMVFEKLRDFGADEELATKIQTICNGVSYSTEIQDFDHITSLITQYSELAVVQDADRLDSIGAIGIGRAFTFGGAKAKRGMQDTVHIFDKKLFLLENLMKTESGKTMARERTQLLRDFKESWEKEAHVEMVGLDVLKLSTDSPVEISRE
ncbi:hypothetical protein G7Y89_g5101 [Cudoniella acicularis]|uniref:HD/PDEase domain-containing protein n=1 Tax=Cudoniella acicularis TaxID=354080 RepID=A0A8H4W6T4_9HELO|nr:hypothetical protein G7Y89_g5101 [Cudoniella acicularis]